MFNQLRWTLSNESMQDDGVVDLLRNYVKFTMIPEMKDFIEGNKIMFQVAKGYCEVDGTADDALVITRNQSKKNAEAASSNGEYYHYKTYS